MGGWVPNFLEVVLLCKSNNRIGIYRACAEAGREVSPAKFQHLRYEGGLRRGILETRSLLYVDLAQINAVFFRCGSEIRLYEYKSDKWFYHF